MDTNNSYCSWKTEWWRTPVGWGQGPRTLPTPSQPPGWGFNTFAVQHHTAILNRESQSPTTLPFVDTLNLNNFLLSPSVWRKPAFVATIPGWRRWSRTWTRFGGRRGLAESGPCRTIFCCSIETLLKRKSQLNQFFTFRFNNLVLSSVDRYEPSSPATRELHGPSNQPQCNLLA